VPGKRTPEVQDDEDLTRVDPSRTDEDDGGTAAPPLRPRDETDQRNKPAGTSKPSKTR
jgi:hypothetical protein